MNYYILTKFTCCYFLKAAGCVLAEMYLKEVFVHTRGLPGIQPILQKFGTPTDWSYQWDKFGEKIPPTNWQSQFRFLDTIKIISQLCQLNPANRSNAKEGLELLDMWWLRPK